MVLKQAFGSLLRAKCQHGATDFLRAAAGMQTEWISVENEGGEIWEDVIDVQGLDEDSKSKKTTERESGTVYCAWLTKCD